VSKSYRRPGTDDKYRDDREFRRSRKDAETKSQKKRTVAALKRRDATAFYEEDDEEE
jgi:hypothetical protein